MEPICSHRVFLINQGVSAIESSLLISLTSQSSWDNLLLYNYHYNFQKIFSQTYLPKILKPKDIIIKAINKYNHTSTEKGSKNANKLFSGGLGL